jgi:hypothetical protein
MASCNFVLDGLILKFSGNQLEVFYECIYSDIEDI